MKSKKHKENQINQLKEIELVSSVKRSHCSCQPVNRVVRYRFTREQADRIINGDMALFSMALNAAMHDLKLPIGITLRRNESECEVVVEQTASL